MSTTKNTNDSKKMGGYLKEKFTIGFTRVNGDEVTRAIMKTTSHMLKAPNDKHLNRLLAASHGHVSEGQPRDFNMNAYIVEELEKRTHTHNWVVVLKTMVALHRIMMEGSDAINKVMQRNRSLFCTRNVKDLADSPDGVAQKQFIALYIRYLEERNITQARIDLDVRIEAPEYLTILKTMSLDVLAQVMTQLIQQLECIGGIIFRAATVDNFATLEAYVRLICDGKVLYVILSDRMLYVLDQFESLETTQSKQTWLLLYRRYHKAVHGVVTLFEALSASGRHFGMDIPRLKEYPEALGRRLEEEVECSQVPKETVEDLGLVLHGDEAAGNGDGDGGDTDAKEEEEAEGSGGGGGGGGTAPAALPPAEGSAPLDLFGNNGNGAVAQAPPPQQQNQDTLDDLFGGTPAAAAPPQQGKEQPPTWVTNEVPAPAPAAGGGFDDFFTGKSAPAARSAPPAAAQNPTEDEDFASVGDTPHTVTTRNASATAKPSFDPFGNEQRQNVFSASSAPPASAAQAQAQSQAPPVSQGGPSSAQQEQNERPHQDMDDLFGGPTTAGAGASKKQMEGLGPGMFGGSGAW